MEAGTSGDGRIDPCLREKTLMSSWLTNQHLARGRPADRGGGIFKTGILASNLMEFDASKGQGCYIFCRENGVVPEGPDEQVFICAITFYCFYYF